MSFRIGIVGSPDRSLNTNKILTNKLCGLPIVAGSLALAVRRYSRAAANLKFVQKRERAIAKFPGCAGPDILQDYCLSSLACLDTGAHSRTGRYSIEFARALTAICQQW
jgi:hypothetical protein